MSASRWAIRSVLVIWASKDKQRTKSSLSSGSPLTLSGEAPGCTRPRLRPGLHAEPHAEAHAEVPPTWDFRALGLNWTSRARWRA